MRSHNSISLVDQNRDKSNDPIKELETAAELARVRNKLSSTVKGYAESEKQRLELRQRLTEVLDEKAQLETKINSYEKKLSSFIHT